MSTSIDKCNPFRSVEIEQGKPLVRPAKIQYRNAGLRVVDYPGRGNALLHQTVFPEDRKAGPASVENINMLLVHTKSSCRNIFFRPAAVHGKGSDELQLRIRIEMIEPISSMQVPNTMLDYDYRFSMNGTIFINGDDKALLVLDKKLLKEFRYNSRVYEANKFNVATVKEAELLSRIYHVKKDDILIQEHMDKKNTVYSDMINSYLAHSSDLHSTLREKGILFVEDDNLVYLIDKKNKVIISTDDLGINIIKDGYSKDRITLVTLDKMERINVEQDSELARGFNLIDAICDILSQHINVQQDKSPNRKKKRGQQQN